MCVGFQDVLVSTLVNKDSRHEHVFRRYNLLSQHISATTEINIWKSSYRIQQDQSSLPRIFHEREPLMKGHICKERS